MKPHERLEREWAEFNGLDPAGTVACSSGTAALHLAFEALGLPAGSEVVCPDYAMVACPRAIALAGLVPVFADCRPDLLMDLPVANEAVNRNTSAVLSVNVYGRLWPSGRDGLMILPAGVRVVEDLAEAHGVPPRPQTDAACWSFYKNKVVAGEEGGTVWFRDPRHAALARQLRTLGFTAAHDYDHVPRGHNYRLADSLAVKVLQGLADYEGMGLSRRRQTKSVYDFYCPPEWKMPPRAVPWVYDLRLRGLGLERRHVLEVVRALNGVGIGARPGFLPMSQQAEFRGCRRVGGDEALKASREILYLPLDPSFPPDRCREAFDVIRTALEGLGVVKTAPLTADPPVNGPSPT